MSIALSKINYNPNDNVQAADLNNIAKNSNKIFESLVAGEYLDIFGGIPTPVFIEDVDYQPIAENIFLQVTTNEATMSLGYFSGSYRRIGQPIPTGNYNRLNKITFKMTKVGSPTGNFYLRVYACDANKYATGSVLQEVVINIAIISATPTEYEYNLSGLVVSQNTNYIIQLETEIATCNSSNYIALSIGYPINPDYLRRMDYSGNNSIDGNYSTYFKIKGERILSAGEIRVAGKVYTCEADTDYRCKFDGFIFSAVAKDAAVLLQNCNISNEFSGLTPGVIYYAPNYYSKVAAKETNGDDTTVLGSGHYSKAIQTFTSSSNCRKIKKLTLSLSRNSSSYDGTNLSVSLYLADGSNQPTGSALVTKLMPLNTIPYSAQTWCDAVFDGPVIISPSTKYVIVMEYTGTSYLVIVNKQNNDGGTGLAGYWTGSAWAMETNKDLEYRVYGTNGGSISTTPGDSVISVGQSMSATELLIKKFVGDLLSTLSTSQDSVLTLPARVGRLIIYFTSATGSTANPVEVEVKKGRSKSFVNSNYGIGFVFGVSNGVPTLTVNKGGGSTNISLSTTIAVDCLFD